MNGYILSILGIVILGIVIDIIVPNGSINKYIKSIYSVFVLAVILTPLLKIVNNQDFSLNYQEYEIDQSILNYIYSTRADNAEESIISMLEDNGFNGVVINLQFSSENNEFRYNSCNINLENMVIDEDKQHINSYEFITEAVRSITGLDEEEIVYE